MALWTPANLDNVEKWFDASDASTITIAGSGVGVWVDKSGSGVDAFQTEDTYRPAVISGAQNGLDVLNFDGSKMLQFAQDLNQMGRSVIMLFEHQDDGVILGKSATRSYTTPNGGVGSFNLYSSYTSANIASSLGVGVGEYGIAHYGLHETAFFYINGIRDANEYARLNTTPWLYDKIGAFNATPSGFINAKIAEIIVLDSEPSDEDRQKIEGYLAHKWGITSKLLPTHPYYSAAPVTELIVPVSIPNAPDGARYRISNQSRSNAEIANGIVSGGAGISTTFIADDASVPHVEGDTIHVDITYPVSTTAYLPSRVIGQALGSGVSGFVAQVDDEIYNFHGIDGSAITKFQADYVQDDIEIAVASNFVGAEIYAFYVHNLTSESGIREWLGAISAIDNANFRINTSVMSLLFDNQTIDEVWQTDNVRIFRSDGARPVRNPTTGGGGIDVNWRSQVYIAETIVNTSNVPVSEVDGATVVRTKDDLTPILFTFPTANVPTFTKTKRINGGTSESITGAVTYLYELGGKYWYRLAYDASDRPADEGSVQYTFAYNDKTAVINLHVSANVTKAELDSAQASIESNISALNNVSVAEVQTAAANALTAYDAPTKAELDTAQTSIQADIAAQNDISTADIRTELATELARLDATISSRLAAADFTAPDNASITAIKDKTDNLTFTGVNLNAVAKVVEDKTGYALTTAEREAIATQVESSILDENDGQKVLEAIVNAIGNQNIDELTLVAAIRADLERAGGSLDNLPTLSEIESSTVLAKEASITSLNNLSAAEVLTQAEAALTSYDAPTKAELDTAQASIESAITALNNLSTADVLAQAEAALANYDPPTKAELDSVVAALNDISTADVLAQAEAALIAYDAPTKTELDNAVAPLSGVATEASLVIINEGVKKASLLIPHTEDL